MTAECAQAVSYVKNAIAVAVSDAIDTANQRYWSGWAEADVASTAVAIAEIFVQAYAEAGVAVNVDGQGFASGGAEACAEVLDQVVAEAVAVAFAKAVAPERAAEARGLAHALAVALAEAKAVAQVAAQTRGGTAEAHQKSLASVVAQAIAATVAKAYALVFGGADTVRVGGRRDGHPAAIGS